MNRTEKTRSALLSLVMLVVLLASVLAAWSLVTARGAMFDRAAAVIQEIREKTLPSLLGGKPVTTYYLLRDAKGRNLGYTIDTRRPVNGNFSGVRLMRQAKAVFHEQWRLRNDIASGQYLGISQEPARAEETRITLKDKQVTVEQVVGSKLMQVRDAAPSNYIPEGLTPLVIRLVVQRGQKASFKTISDSEAIIQGQLNFTTVTLTPLSDRKVRYEAELFPLGKIDRIYSLDAGGQVLQSLDNAGGITEQAVTYDEIIRAYPEVLRYKAFQDKPDQLSEPPDSEEPADDSNASDALPA
jgi:hypothetical protein